MIMKRQNLSEYYDKYIDAAKLQGEAVQAGDSKTANRQYTILKRIYIKTQKAMKESEEFYRNLRSNSEPNVKLWSCAHSLALGLDIAEAEKILNNLSQNEEIGILSLNAEMTLKVWKEQGYLKF